MYNPTILITGGMGYVGSHTAVHLLRNHYKVVLLDQVADHNNFFSPAVPCYVGSVGDSKLLDTIFSTHPITIILHCAAYIDVGASVQNPLDYYQNNVAEMITLLTSMREYKIPYLLFSSSAAVYGDSPQSILDETTPCHPINPYGHTKLMGEQIIKDCALAYGIKYGILRYFNIAGSDPISPLYEDHHPETHILPLLLRAAFETKPFYLFGTDYPTPDGTAIRDFVLVTDIAQAHQKAINLLITEQQENFVCNIASGNGNSLKTLIAVTEELLNITMTIVPAPRRTGDPAMLIANTNAAAAILGWQPSTVNLKEIISSAIIGYQRQKRPNIQ